MMRNYRQILRTGASGVALGGSSCRVVRDKIMFRLEIVRFSVRDSITALTDSVTFKHEPGAQAITAYDSILTVVQDSGEMEVD